jgi:hypothetical protein
MLGFSFFCILVQLELYLHSCLMNLHSVNCVNAMRSVDFVKSELRP